MRRERQSSLLSLFMKVDRSFYDEMLWSDAGSLGFIRDRFRFWGLCPGRDGLSQREIAEILQNQAADGKCIEYRDWRKQAFFIRNRMKRISV